jgi:putative membrane protein
MTIKSPSTFLMATTLLATAAFALPALAETPYTLTNTTTLTKAPTKLDAQMFVQKAAVGGMFEVQASQLALDKSSDAHIKKIAQMMIDDHTKANDKLKSIVADKNESDWIPDALDDKHQAKLDALQNSDNFDADYIKVMKEGHVKTIAMFKEYAAVGDDADLQAFAKKTLPTLMKHKKHLDMVQL